MGPIEVEYKTIDWAIDLHRDLWPWMILNCPPLKSLKLHVKYLKKWWQIRCC